MSLRSRIRNSFSETFRTLFSPLTLFIWGACVVVATIAAPFGTNSIPGLPERATFWVVVVSFSVLVGYCVRAVSVAVVGADRPALLDCTIVAVMTLIFTPMIWLITHTIHLSQVGKTQSLLVIAGYVMLCTVVVVVGRRLAPGFERQSYQFLPEPEIEPVERGDRLDSPRLLRRLTQDVQGEVLRLTANDHFVEVTTENGAESLRMRLVDAIDEMDPIYGYCVHRSHWVSHAAVARVERESSYKIYIVLTNNDRIPVSRKYRVNVEKAGWI